MPARVVMSKIFRHGSLLAALGAAAGTGWWVGSSRPQEADGLVSAVFGRVSAAALQGYSMQAPAELTQQDPSAPRVTQVRQACWRPSCSSVVCQVNVSQLLKEQPCSSSLLLQCLLS